MGIEEEPKLAGNLGSRSRVGFFDSLSSLDTVGSSKIKTVTSPFLERRKKYFIVGDNFEDVTPALLHDDSFTISDEFVHRVFQSKQAFNTAKSKSRLEISKSSKSVFGGLNIKATRNVFSGTNNVCNLDDIEIDYSINSEEGIIRGTEDDNSSIDRAPSAYYVHRTRSVIMYPPSITFTLKETDTIDLFEQPCLSFEKNSAEGNEVEAENELYLYLTVGKGKHRKRINAETQTKSKPTQSRHTQASKPDKRNGSTFASVWDMHDTFEQLKEQVEQEAEDQMVMFQIVPEKYLRKRKKLLEQKRNDGIYRNFEDLAKTQQFRDAVLLTERILSCGGYKEQQRMFRGFVSMDPLSPDLKYEYTLELLWELSDGRCDDHAVMFCDFNPINEDIVAVAYGKFNYMEQKNGIVCIWCMKNPREPERFYSFENPVTTVCFSKKTPNWLACGFYDGKVIIIDILSYDKNILLSSTRETNPCFEPIWYMTWQTKESTGQEYIMTVCRDGRINKFVKTETNQLECYPMMRVTQIEGRIRGVFKVKPCFAYDIRIRKNPTCLSYAAHPTIDHIYFVGTDEGCLNKCSTHYLNQHMDVTRAHTSYVYDIRFSPFWDCIMATCGADWTVQIWVDGVDESLITLNCPGTVYGISWCPNNATILVSICKNLLHVWDFNRKIYAPSAELKFPRGTQLTYVHFCESGNCIIVCDTSGKLYTFFLRDMPIPPFNQKTVLQDALKKSLHTRPKILHQFEKLLLLQT